MQLHSFGYWLKRRRKALDLTQAELASQVGCSAAAIRKIEAEERRPSVQIAERLAEIFDIPLGERTAFLRFARTGGWSAPIEIQGDTLWQVPTKIPHSNLPAPITSLIGREPAILELQDYLLRKDVRLLTLLGPPGVGKTRLSIEAAHTVLPDFPDGIFFVALASLENPTLIAVTIAQSLGFVGSRNTSTSEQLKEGISDKQMLILLDNCEHLIEHLAILAADLLSSCPRLKILATSRESLRISGEWIFAVPPLTIPKERSPVDMETMSGFPALALFAERARAVHPNFMLDTGNIEAIASICSQLDGLPLAIELMAARMRLMTPQALLEHLNNQFILSANGMRAASTRQKTLQDAIAWSYNLLPEEEQKCFAYLSVFHGGFTQEAAATMLSDLFEGTSISNLLTSLLDKSLLQPVFDDETPDAIRFSMLVTIQHFALDRLQHIGKEKDARNRHLLYFLDLAEQANKEIRGPVQVEWLHRLAALRDNLRSALEWAIETRQTEVALQMAGYLSWFWFRRSDLSEGRQWLDRIVKLPDAPRYPRQYSYTLTQLAQHTWLQSGPKEARPFVEQALSVARMQNDRWNIAWALTILGVVLIQEGNFIEAQSTLEQGKTLFRELHDEWGEADSVICLALGAHNRGDLTSSLALHESALVAFRQLGDKFFENVALRFIGVIHIRQGRSTHGVTALREALLIAQQLDSKYEIASVLMSIGKAAQVDGNYVGAVHLYWASKNIFDSIGVWQQEDEVQFENDLAVCRASLDKAEFEEAVKQGQAMTMERAIAYTLEGQQG